VANEISSLEEDIMTVHIIVFSFNRAMQCDSVLRSILLHVKASHLKVSVIWRATGEHLPGYTRLKELHEPEGVVFHEQGGRPSFLRDVLPRLTRPRNAYHWLRNSYIRRMDNFQPLLERLIRETPCQVISFNTDDTIYYRDELLPKAAFDRILAHPASSSYKVYVGANQGDCPPLKSMNGLLMWDYYDPSMNRHWAYPFSVDGTYYEKSALLSFLRQLLYHNPVTLESYGVTMARHSRLFRTGISPSHSTMVGTALNKVDFLVDNDRANISPASLNRLFLAGYRIEYELPDPMTVSGLIPSRIFACRNDERIEILTGER
jgi:hypothetical protein